MRIDGAIPPTENAQTQNASRAGNSKPQSVQGASSNAPDQAQLATEGGKVSQLTTAVSQMPEVREDRVQALRQSVASGNYQVSNQQLANAIGSDPMASGRTR